MGGVDTQRAHQMLGLDANHEVVCAIAVGYPGDVADLPEALRAREAPTPRKPAAEVARFL